MPPLLTSYRSRARRQGTGFVLSGLLLLGAALPGWAQRIGATVDESGVQVTYHVKPGGNDNSSGLSADQPLGGLSAAIDKAERESLSRGQKTKILVYPGTFNTAVWKKTWSATARATVLIIEGAAQGQVTLRADGGSGSVFSFGQKDNLVLRNLVFTNGSNNGSMWGGNFSPLPPSNQREHDWLVTNCDFRNGTTAGLSLHGIDNVTVQNCTVTNNRGPGISYVGRYGKFVNLTITGNGNGDGANGAFSIGCTNSLFDNITVSDNRGPGLRQDWTCENLTVTNSRFERNGQEGMIFEVCLGPVLLRNCVVANNGKAGIDLITVHGMTLDNCRLTDNAEAQLLVNPQDRSEFIPPDAGSAANLELEDWLSKKPILWVRNTKILNSTLCVTQANSTAKLIKRFDQTNYLEYAKWFRDEYQGSGNKFTAPNNGATAFDVSTLYFPADRAYGDLAGWRQATGEDAGSTFSARAPGPRPCPLRRRPSRPASASTPTRPTTSSPLSCRPARQRPSCGWSTRPAAWCCARPCRRACGGTRWPCRRAWPRACTCCA
jgi:hypothetical protein